MSDTRSDMQNLMRKLRGQSMASDRIKRVKVKKDKAKNSERIVPGKRGCSRCNRRKKR